MGYSAEPSDNVYVTDLPLGMEDETLKALFEQYGPVVQHRVLPTNNGQTKAAALVRFDSVETATFIVDSLNGQLLDGLEEPIKIRYADPPKGKGKARPGPYSGGPAGMAAIGDGGSWKGKGVGKGDAGAGAEQMDNLYVKGFPPTATDVEVKSIFGQYGTITSCRVFTYPTYAAALVRFGSTDEAIWVKENVNGAIPEGLEGPVEIKYYVPKNQGDGGDKGWGKGKGFAAGGPASWAPPAGKGGVEAAWQPPAAKGAVKGGKGLMGMKEIVKGIEASGAMPGTGGWAPPGASLYVSGLPADTEDLDLFKLFNPFGAIQPKGVRVMTLPDGSCKGIGFANFQDPAAAQEAINALHGTVMPDQTLLTVKVKTDNPGKGKA